MILRLLARAVGILLLLLAFYAGFVAYQLAFTGPPLPNESLLGVIIFGTVMGVTLLLGLTFLWLGRRRRPA